MTTLDIILLICFLPAVYTGLKHGLIHQLVGIAIVALSIWLGTHCGAFVAAKLAHFLHLNELGLKIAAFTVIFIGTFIGLKILGALLEGAVKLIMLGWLNKLLGVILAMVKYGLLICLVVMMFDSINSLTGLVKGETLEPCVVYNFLKDLAYSIFQWRK